ncbi:MAG: phosphoglucosamine mutase [Actinomycetota bacterium]|jgi:phosphoglucosamine mutase|nr:phosphoglucosamine mutase [Actinomycetota bacterium]
MEIDPRKLFGTDGIRGVANTDLTPEFVLKTGKAISRFICRDKKHGKILIGKDTRPSCDFIEASLSAGIMSEGCDVLSAGILSTPGIAIISKLLDTDGAIVISASHNPLEDNGIKIFKKGGIKLTDSEEKDLEDIILSDSRINREEKTGLEIGRQKIISDSLDIYIDYITKGFKFDLNGLKIAVDCANGATSVAVPKVLSMFGAEVISFNTDIKSGLINKDCGSTHPEVLQRLVRESKADIGFSYDGDGDRVIGCDRFSRILDGDVFLAFSAILMKENNILKNNGVVTTIMANYGLEKAMQEKNIIVYKTKVGDRYVLEKMIEKDVIIGAEQSGHIIFNNFSSIGDGLLSTLIFLNFLSESKQDPDLVYDIIEHYPQVLKNIRVKDKNLIMKSPELIKKIADAESYLQGEGKIVVRSSGTESLVRVMVEAKTMDMVKKIQEDICNFILTIK